MSPLIIIDLMLGQLFLGIFIGSCFFVFWSNILTKESSTGRESTSFLYKLAGLTAILYLLHGFLITKSPQSWLNALICGFLFCHTYLADKKYSQNLKIFFLELSFATAFILSTQFVTMYLEELFFGYVNSFIAIADYIALSRKEKKGITDQIIDPEAKDAARYEMEQLFVRYEKNGCKIGKIHENERELLFTILLDDIANWIGLPVDIQDMYFIDKIKRTKKIIQTKKNN